MLYQDSYARKIEFLMKHQITHFSIFLWLLIVLQTTGFSQGKIMIVGGGTENYNDWSNIPYTWAVDQSANKKVAIVSFSTESSWLPNYFISLGAAAAKNFRIHTSALANSQATYDSLMAYDVIFFKGGNQANYYLTYKNSKVQDAVTDNFNSGGVIAGTSAGLAILSGVVYTAENGTAYSDDCLKNIFHSSITLKNDFINLMPGYIFDSHFIERGRLARLLAFMARWKHDTNEDITGIGVDDMTAFCIDLSDPDNKMGYAWGTAAVNIYRDGELGHHNNKLYCKDVKAIQLLHDCAINLNTFEVTGFNSMINVETDREFINKYILLSGSDPVSENQLFISHFINAGTGQLTPILIITGSSTTLANAYKQAFITAGASNVEIGQALPANQNDPGLQALINQAGALVFVGNAYQTFYDFVNSGSGNGALLSNKIWEVCCLAFVGDNSRMAGAYVVSDNYLTNPNASFTGQLAFNPGLNLLQTMIIMPNTYLYSTDYWENTNSAIPWGMLEKQVCRGVWLTVGNFMEFYDEFPYSYITVHGESPAMILTSLNDRNYDLNAQLFRNRQVAGFEEMDFRTLLYPDKINVGDLVYGLPGINRDQTLIAYYDPGSKQIVAQFEINVTGDIHFSIYDLNGRMLKHEHLSSANGREYFRIHLPNTRAGLYIIRVQSDQETLTRKVMVQP